MSTRWVAIDVVIGDNPKVWRFSSALFPSASGKFADVILAASVGHISMLLGQVKIHAPDGNVADVPDDLLELWAKWRGKRGVFAPAWRKEFAPDGHVNDWEEWNGRLIKQQEAERKRWHDRKERAAQRGDSTGDSTEDNTEPPRAPTHPPTNPTPKPVRRSRADAGDNPDFDAAWSRYPKREGSNPRKAALRAWRGRRQEGVPAADLLAGVERYRAYCEARGMTGQRFVMQAARFFGPDKQYAEAWAVAAPVDPLEQRAAAMLRDEDEQERRDAEFIAQRRAQGGA